MWIFSQEGFYSIVQKGEGFHVRARREQDLVNVGLTATMSYAGSDSAQAGGFAKAHGKIGQFG
jgi:hypothetical protein